MYRQYQSLALAGAVFLFPSLPALCQDTDPALQDVILVTSAALSTTVRDAVRPEAGPLQGGDLTYLTARMPGGARIGNGELSGQMQYRGLFGDRLNLRVDGQRFASGGPNLMDPVFHYAPSVLVAALIVDRGVSPVSAGPGLAGGADAVFKRVEYAATPEAELGYDLSVDARSVNSALAAGGVAGLSTQSWRANLLASREEAGDMEYAGGTIAGTSYRREVTGLSAGLRHGAGEFSLDLRRQHTGASGNPPFPMDIVYFDTDFAKATYRHQLGTVSLDAGAHFSDVAHLMDNVSLRPPPLPMAQRATFAEATTYGGDIAVSTPFRSGNLAFGVDGERTSHDVVITNPNNPDFFISAFPDVELSRFGGFAEWQGNIGPTQTEVGLRIDRHTFDSQRAFAGSAVPPGPVMISEMFNQAERSGNRMTVDGVVRLWIVDGERPVWRLTFAHKQKMPGYIQRFGWLPINASGGLADGNIYVGDLSLDPETAWIAEAGVDYKSKLSYFRPTVFVRNVSDYIQGVPYDGTEGLADTLVERVAGMSGDTTPLRWENVDARLYGFDFDAGVDIPGPLRIDAVFSYVRGVRRDIRDNLYRISPPSMLVAANWEEGNWSWALEGRFVARQERVSRTNGELATDGYAVLSSYVEWRPDNRLLVAAGIENLLDEAYRDHLSGYNRNGYGDVPTGERVPGPGRGAFLRLTLSR